MGPECRGIPVLDFKNADGLGFHSEGWIGFRGLVPRDGLGSKLKNKMTFLGLQ